MRPRHGRSHALETNAGVAELADAMDSKSIFRKEVGVRVPPPAPSLPRQAWDCPFLVEQAT